MKNKVTLRLDRRTHRLTDCGQYVIHLGPLSFTVDIVSNSLLITAALLLEMS